MQVGVGSGPSLGGGIAGRVAGRQGGAPRSEAPRSPPQLDPDKRITPKEALRHPFIKVICDVIVRCRLLLCIGEGGGAGCFLRGGDIPQTASSLTQLPTPCLPSCRSRRALPSEATLESGRPWRQAETVSHCV